MTPQKLFLFLRYLNFCADFLSHVGKQLDKKAKPNFKIHDVTSSTNDCNTHIAQISKKKHNQIIKIGQLIEYNMRHIFLEKSETKCSRETSPRLIS